MRRATRAERLAIDWEPLPAVVDAMDALRPEAVQVFAGAPGNVAFDARLGDGAKTDEAFAKAARAVRITIVNPRVVANYMEPRGAVASFDPDTGRLTLHVGSQGVHGLRDALAKVLKIPPEQLRVTTGDVGGGFGTRVFLYREYPLLLAAARKLGRPVRWQADRSEHFVGDTHGRDNVATAEMALDDERAGFSRCASTSSPISAPIFPSSRPYVPWLGVTMATGPYAIGALSARVRGVYTHTVPVDAYRGAGRPEAAYVLERLVDRCARETGLSQEDIRLRNFVPSDAMPYKTQTNRTYDVGDFAGALDAVRREGRRRRFRRPRRGRPGRAACCAAWAWRATSNARRWARASPKRPSMLEKDGTFTLLIGTQSTGQGHETAYAQVVSERFDIPLERIRVVQGDTDRVRSGGGTGGSRSIPIGAVTTARAAKTLANSLADLAADRLEAAPADLEIVDGRFRIVGTDRSLTLAEVAALSRARRRRDCEGAGVLYPRHGDLSQRDAYLRGRDRSGDRRRAARSLHDRRRLRRDPQSPAARGPGARRRRPGRRPGADGGRGLRRRRAAPHRELHGLLHAAGRRFPADRLRDAQRALDHQSDGLEGRGRSGTIGATPAVVNAVADALWRAYGVADIDMPATPQAIFRAIRKAEASKATRLTRTG